MTPTATGRRERRGDATYLVLEREFRAPAEDVWAALTDPDRLVRWIGTWTGDPASGEVAFRMTAEGEDAPEEAHRIIECDPPRRLVTESSPDADSTIWRLELDLAEAGGTTTLSFAQRVGEGIPVDSVGPGWDYYLDRLRAAETTGEVAAVAWDDYYPALAEHYRAEFG